MRVLLVVLFVASTSLPAQEARDPYRPIRSLGLPPHLAAFGGLAAVGGLEGPFTAGGRVFLGVRHELIRPAMGILGVAAEGYGGVVGGEFEGGARVYGTVRAFLLQAGVEFATSRPGVPLFTMAFEDPLVRAACWSQADCSGSNGPPPPTGSAWGFPSHCSSRWPDEPGQKSRWYPRLRLARRGARPWFRIRSRRRCVPCAHRPRGSTR